MNESIRDVIRSMSLKEATPVSVGDLRKLFPKRQFKGWKGVKSKKDVVWYEKGDFVFRVEDSDGFPNIALKWPVSVGDSFIPSGRSWSAKKSGNTYTLLTYSDEDTLSADVALLKKIMKIFIEKAEQLR